MADRWGTDHLAGATAALTRAARGQRDRRLQQALLELAEACDAFDRAGDYVPVDAERLSAKARALADTAETIGADEAAAAAPLRLGLAQRTPPAARLVPIRSVRPTAAGSTGAGGPRWQRNRAPHP